MTTTLHIAFSQHHGYLVPRQEDALLVAGALYQVADLAPRARTVDVTAGLCALADGVAAAPCPQRASRAVLDLLRAAERDGGADCQDGWIGPRLIRRQVHAQLCRQLGRNPRTRGTATTLALLQWRADQWSLVNVGDSRVYRIGQAGDWRQLSLDHTYRQSMIARGEIAADQPLGQLYNDLEQMLIADDNDVDFAIHWQRGTWQPGDTFLLCTDGVHDTLGEARLQSLFQPGRALVDQVAVWRDAVLAAGAPDNFSLLLLRLTAVSTV